MNDVEKQLLTDRGIEIRHPELSSGSPRNGSTGILKRMFLEPPFLNLGVLHIFHFIFALQYLSKRMGGAGYNLQKHIPPKCYFFREWARNLGFVKEL